MEEQKDPSLKLTNSKSPGKTIADLRAYNEDMTPVEFKDYPRIKITTAENEEKYQHGIIKLEVQGTEFSLPESYWLQVDGLMSVVYHTYANSLNDLRKPTFRQKTARIHGIIRRIFNKIIG